jgi:hypothetical protein
MWRCPKCQSKVDDSFDVCWSCGTTPDGIEDPNFVTADEADPIPDEELPEGAELDDPLADFGGTPMPELVDCYSALSTIEAKFIADQLMEQGIPAIADKIDMYQAMGGHGPKVRVRQDDLPKAQSWLKFYEQRRKSRQDDQDSGMEQAMWKELIQQFTSECEFSEPVSPGQIIAADSSLGVEMPADLRELLCETNGVQGEYGLGLVWKLDRIVQDNLMFRHNANFRDLYMPFDHLYFFADAGNGDQFAFPIQADGLIHRLDVFVWNHEDDSRSWVASSLKDYLDRWLTGRLKL